MSGTVALTGSAPKHLKLKSIFVRLSTRVWWLECLSNSGKLFEDWSLSVYCPRFDDQSKSPDPPFAFYLIGKVQCPVL